MNPTQENDINEAFFLLNTLVNDLEKKETLNPGMMVNKRAFRGKSLDKLEKDLAEAFAILGQMKVYQKMHDSCSMKCHNAG